jgi:hypothetical protein
MAAPTTPALTARDVEGAVQFLPEPLGDWDFTDEVAAPPF